MNADGKTEVRPEDVEVRGSEVRKWAQTETEALGWRCGHERI